MAKKVLFVGIDGDDNRYSIAVFDPLTGKTESTNCGASAEFLRRKLSKFVSETVLLKCCYEATYVGFALARKIVDFGYECEVVASSLIPTLQSDRVKTDRLDAQKLARMYASGMLTVVARPTKEAESHRMLLRSRKFLVHQVSRTKLHLLSTLRVLGLSYKDEERSKYYWTLAFKKWLKEKLILLDPCSRFEIEILLEQLKSQESLIERFDQQVDILAQNEVYREKVKALTVYRSISTISAMTIITEIFDIGRFDHPKKLMSYAGLDIAEYSSGGNERKYSITKMGSRHLRTAVVEACQYATRPVVVSRALKNRRSEVSKEYIEIADRCMSRLSKKGQRLLYRGKPQNKIKVALAREMLGFIWESLRKEKLARVGTIERMIG